MCKKFFKLGLGLLAGASLLVSSTAAAVEGYTGSAAIAALGNNLPAVAARYGRTTNELAAMFNRDSEVRLTTNGSLVYVCSYQPSPVSRSAPRQIFPLNQTFLLHSKPGSTKTIYLDFDGMVISGTSWNVDFNGGADIIAPPWDIDGNPGSFNAAEQIAIQNVWFRVAEDYAPFDVDVTTEYPGEAALTRSSLGDQVYGTRALISPIASQIVPAGGVAYLDAFSEVGDFHKPALVFPENLGNDPKNIGEACSHEVGHNLNLTHQGTSTQAYFLGQGNWAPIMGAGYYVSVSQWAKGEYQDANNHEDELAFITSSGLNYRTNVFGTNIATATPFLGVNNVTNGIISRTGVTNFFSFQTGAGNATITVTNWEMGSDLHLNVGVYDPNGVVITNLETADDPVLGTQPVTVTLPVNNGKYFVSIAGKGYLNPLTDGYSNYGSLGNYSLAITNPFGTGTFIPAPAGPWGTNLAVMNGRDPNGAWYLFIQDDKAQDAGMISNGWFITLTTANPIGSAADNQLYLTPTNPAILLGSQWACVLAVTNYGPSISSNIHVIDSLPVNLSPISTQPSAGSVTPQGDTLVWNVGNLAVNAGATLTLTFQPGLTGIYSNAAVVTSDSDPNPDDDIVSATLKVTSAQPPVLSLLSYSVGGGFQFSVSGNPGTSTIIQGSTNLINWVSLMTNNSPFVFADSAATNYPQRFYRAVTAP